MTEMMKAVGVYRPLPLAAPDALVDIEIPRPVPQPRDLLVQVEAISVNPADYRSRIRKIDDGKLAILGWDVAGTVVQTGSDVSSTFSVGDKVFYAGDNSRQGGNSQFHVVDHRIVGHRPIGISATSAAALPLVTLTAWEALFDRLGLSMERPNRFRSLLIIGGAGGVGSMALQLARQVPNITLIATASRVESSEWCSSMGADFVVDHHQPLASELQAIGFLSVDAVLLLNSPDMHFDSLSEI